jgi:O-antigen/teichoic acid export membrane protein
MSDGRPLFSRLWNSAVVWSWGFNGLRLSSYLVILPILSRVLSENDFGFYWVLVNLAGMVPLLDLGFSTAVDRALSYAMGGARELKAHGIADPVESEGRPNFELLWKLMFTTRWLYRLLSLGVFLFLGTWGSFVAHMRLGETSNPGHAWLAWGLTLIAAVFETYSGWWNVYLRGLNQVLLCSRILVLSFGLRTVLAGGLLIAGAGLLSVPVATLISSFLQRGLSRHYALRFLATKPCPAPGRAELVSLLRTLWPNTWRVGVHCLSNYLTPHANTVLCTKFFGLAANAQYGLSVQIMAILQGMSMVWVQVKWPVIGQYLAQHSLSRVERVLKPRLRLQLLSFLSMAVVAIPLTPRLLEWLNTDKAVLPQPWFAVLALVALLDMHSNTWATFISIGNRLPFLSATVLTNFVSLGLAIALIHFSSFGVGALVLAPLIANAAYNYWRWPREGARILRTTWLAFIFRNPR